MVFKDCNDFIKKIKDLRNIPDNVLLVTADVVGLYPGIAHKAGLRHLKKHWIEGKKKDLY